MTTFDDQDTGLDSGNPIELFRFYGLDGSYTYTSSNRQFTFKAPSSTDPEIYQPIPVQRTEVVLGDVTEKNQITITLPKNVQLVNDYVFDIGPSDDLNIEIYRLNGVTGIIQQIFYGVVAGISVQENKAVFTCPSTFSNYLDTEFPNIFYQSVCNYTLYGAGCNVDPTLFTTVGNIVSIDEAGTTIEFTVTAGPTSGFGSASDAPTHTFNGITYDFSDTVEWDNYLVMYPSVAAEATKELASSRNFPTVEAYAAWHYQRFGKFQGFVATPTLLNTEIPDSWLCPGEVIKGNERRLIVAQVGNTMTISYPFRGLAIGDEVQMLAGCLHTSNACNTKFNNGPNFLGFEFIPYINPFQVGIQ